MSVRKSVASPTAARAKRMGLKRAEVEVLGLRDVTAKESKRLGCAPRPGILIPYRDLSGRESASMRRIRFTDGDEPKYGQPRGLGPALYVPHLEPVDWPAFVNEPEEGPRTKRTPLVVVEGELKAVTVARLGVPCVALGGVWSWQSKKQARELIPDLERMDLAGRDVYVAFDSDVARNPNVSAAREALTHALVRHSARVHWVEVPDLDATSKATGIDDYVLAQPDPSAALAALLEGAVAHAGLGDLLALNRHYLHVQGPKATGVYSHRDGRFLTYAVFDRELAGRKVLRRSARGSQVEVPLATVWLDWPQRSRAKGFCFRPGLAEGAQPDGAFNVAPPHPVPVRGDVKPFLELVDFLFQHEDASTKRWFLGWCAHPFKLSLIHI